MEITQKKNEPFMPEVKHIRPNFTNEVEKLRKTQEISSQIRQIVNTSSVRPMDSDA